MSVGPSGQELLFEVRRKLTAIGIETQFTARGDTLKGTLALEGAQVIPNPLGGAPIDRIAFTLQGDDVLRIDQPEPARGLQGPHALRLASIEELAAALRDAIDARAARLRGQALRLSTLGLGYELDAERLALTARMDLGQLGVAELDSDGEHVVLRELVDTTSNKRRSFDEIEIDLESFDDRLDLELFVTSHAEKLVPDRASQSIVSGHLAPDFHDIPDLEIDDDSGQPVGGQLAPLVGQVWVMEVRVESDDGEEVRYKGVNLAGRTYGAPRVLPKIAFEAAYARVAQSLRMQVQVLRVDDETVHYVKLDSQRRSVGPERAVSVVGFLANFMLDGTSL